MPCLSCKLGIAQGKIMKEIPLTKGFVVKVDDEDYVRLKVYSWCLGQGGYAVRGGRKEDGQESRRNIPIHRQILNCIISPNEVDHINGDRLDCRKENLRLVTRGINQRNKVKKSFGTEVGGSGRYRSDMVKEEGT